MDDSIMRQSVSKAQTVNVGTSTTCCYQVFRSHEAKDIKVLKSFGLSICMVLIFASGLDFTGFFGFLHTALPI